MNRLIVLIMGVFLLPLSVHAVEGSLYFQLKEAISQHYPNTRVQIEQVKPEPETGVAASSIQYLQETRPGEALFELKRVDGNPERIHVQFSAWKNAPIAVRRILPRERLDESQFKIQELNIAQGIYHETKGLLLDSSAKLSGLEAMQTIVEGTVPLMNAVRKVPDLQKGDLIHIHIHSGGLVLTTPGTAEEPAYLGGTVRVMSMKNKREMVGKVEADKVVEVNL